ncbi:MAG: hypothetical protein ACTHM1_12655 [Solirubrobacteraceae bacterium]
MKKIRVICVAIMGVGLSALFVASASAGLGWLKNGEAIAKAEATNSDVSIVLHKTGGSLGSGEVRCNLVLKGTVGPSAVDEIAEVTDLAGSEKNLVKCERVSGFCFSPVMHALKLPWKTELVLEAGVTWDQVTGVEYEFLCTIGTVSCKFGEKVKFIKNVSSGAEFEFAGEESGSGPCSDGGTSFITGTSTALGVTVSS